MFSRIEGTLQEKTEDGVLVTVGGLTYPILLPRCVADKLADRAVGEPVRLEIFSYLQIDGNRATPMYIGFTNGVEREFFEALLSVASIGPKTAVKAFSRPMAEIARFIDEGDHASLRRLPGIGDQKAKDIIAKLQGKVARFCLIQGGAPAPPAQTTPDFVAEAIDVLLQLQYRRSEAERMAREALAHNGAVASAEELLNEIYRRQQHAPPARRGGGA